MKELIENYYSIQVLGYIKITKKTYKIKTNDKFYYLKFIENNNIGNIIDYIESMHLNCFVGILKNKDNSILTIYHNTYFYLMEELNDSIGSFKEIKLKFYFEVLSYIHSQSCYNIKVNNEYFKRIYKDINEVINERENYYTYIMSQCEKDKFRSPSQWLFLLNYYRIQESLNQAKYYLQEYMNNVKDCITNRVCLIYKNFNYDHIFLKDKKISSLDYMEINMPIYDIYDVYKKLPEILFDLDCFSEYYLKNMKLEKKEILLLCTLLNVVPVIALEDDEINNIIKISRLLYYIDSIKNLSKELDIKNEREFH